MEGTRRGGGFNRISEDGEVEGGWGIQVPGWGILHSRIPAGGISTYCTLYSGRIHGEYMSANFHTPVIASYSTFNYILLRLFSFSNVPGQSISVTYWGYLHTVLACSRKIFIY